MSRVSRKKQACKQEAPPATIPITPLLADPSPVVFSLHDRKRVLKESPINKDVWTLIYAAIELRELIIVIGNRIEAGEKDGGDPAVDALVSAGVRRPHESQWYGEKTFSGVVKRFDAIADKINEEIGCICGELPPPPAALDRRGAA